MKKYLFLFLVLFVFHANVQSQTNNSAKKQKKVSLDLSEKDLTEIPKRVKFRRNLTDLNVSNNYITQLPAWIGKLKNLQTLIVDNNLLTTVPKELANLDSLRYLSLSNNIINSLPKEIFLLSNLRVLDINQNQLETIPKEIGNFKKLSSLSIAENGITSLPDELERLSNLKTLDIDGIHNNSESGVLNGIYYKVPPKLSRKEQREKERIEKREQKRTAKENIQKKNRKENSFSPSSVICLKGKLPQCTIFGCSIEYPYKITEKNYQDAIKYYNQLCTDDCPIRKSDSLDFSETFNQIGILLSTNNKNDSAIYCFQRATELDPSDFWPWYNMANEYYDKKEYEKAISSYEKGIWYNRNFIVKDSTNDGVLEWAHDQVADHIPIAWSKIAWCYYKTEKYDSALQFFKYATTLSNAEKYYFTQLDSTNNNKLGNILPFKNALLKDSISEEVSEIYNWEANCYYVFHKEDSAVLFYKKSAKANPDFYWAWYNLANIYFEDSMYNEAIVSYQKAFMLDSVSEDNNQIRRNLAIAHFKIKNYKEAEICIQKAIELKPEDTYNYYILAFTKLFQGKYEEAKTIFVRIKNEPIDSNQTYKQRIIKKINKMKKNGEIPLEYQQYTDNILKIMKKD